MLHPLEVGGIQMCKLHRRPNLGLGGEFSIDQKDESEFVGLEAVCFT